MQFYAVCQSLCYQQYKFFFFLLTTDNCLIHLASCIVLCQILTFLIFSVNRLHFLYVNELQAIAMLCVTDDIHDNK
jgi:hypothetical protein